MQDGYHVDQDDLQKPSLARPLGARATPCRGGCQAVWTVIGHMRRLPLIVMPAGAGRSLLQPERPMDMPYAKTSLRAEQRVLREKMRAVGMSHRQIAVEFARRYRLRPRAAWRHAYGWSQTEAAEQISNYAAHAGLGPDGTTVTMTGPHLCEYENWPGEGPEPAGRRPTPYLLSQLAAVYGCNVHDLLDVADFEHMPSADRVIAGKSAPTAGQHGHGQEPAVIAEGKAASQPQVAIEPVSLSPDSGRLTSWAVFAPALEPVWSIDLLTSTR